MIAALRVGLGALFCGVFLTAGLAQARSPAGMHGHTHGFGHRFDQRNSGELAAVLGGDWGGYGYGGSCYPYFGIDDREVPFYALFPPVYYSYPVPRTYGYSPFAYPPGVETPAIVDDGGPKEIINPYVPPSNKAKPMSGRMTDDQSTDTLQRVQVVVNPFVTERVAER